MLDAIICEGCGRNTYAQMARCPQCGRTITVPHSKLNLPPEYVYENEMGVWVYPDRLAAAKLNFVWFAIGCLILGGGLYALRFLMSGDYWGPGLLGVFLLSLVLGAPIVFQTLHATFRLFSALPVFYMDGEGMAFPYISSTLLPWKNIRDAQVVETLPNYRVLKIDLNTPMEMTFTSMARLLVRGPQQVIAIPIVSGWPISPEDARELILLGLETWVKDPQKPSSSPTHPQEDFNRTIKQALGFAILMLLVPLIFVIIAITA